MFDIKEMVVETDNDGKVYLNLLMDINCYFYTTVSAPLTTALPSTTAVRIWTSAATSTSRHRGGEDRGQRGYEGRPL